jgi:plasmid stability protein
MATLYVENVPDDLYEALRERARKNHRSIAAEVIGLLEDFVPTERELRRRRQLFSNLKKLRAQRSPSSGPFPSAEEMLREDRDR